MWNRSFHERSDFAPKRSFMMRAQMRRAARNFAISSKKSECELKKNEIRGANSSTSRPASIARLHVFDPVAQGERQLLRRRGAGFADVIAADRDRVPARHFAAAEYAIMSVIIRIDGRGG